MYSFNYTADAPFQGTDNLFRIAKQMTSLCSFLFVSSAYIHGKNANRAQAKNVCNENLRPLRIDPYKIVNTISRTSGTTWAFFSLKLEGQDQVLSKAELGAYPNTHAFTKHLAENILAHNMDACRLFD